MILNFLTTHTQEKTVTAWGEESVTELDCGGDFTVHSDSNQITTVYTLNTHNLICELHLGKALKTQLTEPLKQREMIGLGRRGRHSGWPCSGLGQGPLSRPAAAPRGAPILPGQ